MTRDEEDTSFPMARRLAEEAAREEVSVLLQFFTFRQQLASFLRAAAAAGLPVIVLKGAALAETAYPRPGLRPFGDIDLLVRPSHVTLGRSVLESLGCGVEAPRWHELVSGEDRQANFFRATEGGPVVFELHVDLINNDLLSGAIRLDLEGLWARARPARLAGEDALILGPEDQLVHLCVHLAGHYLAAPRSLRDIAQVCEATLPDWALFVSLARRAGAGPACFAALSAASRLLGVPIPAAVREALAPRFGSDRLERIAVASASNAVESPNAGGSLTEGLRFALLWRLLDGPRPRLRAISRLLFPSRRWLIAHYYFGLYDEAEWPDTSGSPTLGQALRHCRMVAVLYRAHLSFMGGRAFGRRTAD